MNYREFQEHRVSLLKARPDLIDLAETNPWRALAALTPPLPADSDVAIHQRDVATAWLRTFSLDEAMASRVLISSGVRHSLSLILPKLAARSAKLLLPIDVYPVYGQLALAAGVATATFPTIPEFELCDDGDWLLVPNPLKPAGRWLSTAEVSQIKQWLTAKPDRRLLLDIVYTFQRRLHLTTRELLQTGQTVLLHSLSKGWLHQQLLGVALIPECEQAALAAPFCENVPNPVHLIAAQHLLSSFAEYPDILEGEIRRRRERMLNRLPETVRNHIRVCNDSEVAGYLRAIPLDSRELLEKYQLFTAPLTIFGSPRTDHCVMSALSFR